MGLLIGFAFLGGIITVLSPCVLPVLPIIFSGSVAEGQRRPYGIIAGFILSFSLLTLTLTFLVRAFGIDPGILRYAAGGIIIVFSVVLIVPWFKEKFMAFINALLNKRKFESQSKNSDSNGFFAGVLTGFSLGAVWTPCVGPIMASVITLAISQSLDAGAVFITLSYALGTSIPLFAVMKGGRGLIQRFPLLSKNLSTMQRVFGVLMLVAGISLFTGWDRDFQSWMLNAFPKYGAGLTSIEDNEKVQRELENREKESEMSEIPDKNGSDPLSRTSGVWFNSEPLTLEKLKGKVVLVDFWTYSCINCLRTMPYLKNWHTRYADKGLVIIGVHTPEFAFERDSDNVLKAIKNINVLWPVVQDNDYGIWNAFSNRYWPAHYIFDRKGKLVSMHFGEGKYSETESLIQSLLGVQSYDVEVTENHSYNGINPETYLGSDRGIEQVSEAQNHFSLKEKPKDFSWGIEGYWKQSGEYIKPDTDGKLFLHFNAKEVYLVISKEQKTSANIEVHFNGAAVNTVDVINGKLQLEESRLYTVYSSEKKMEGILILNVSGDVKLHAFTFM